jgi:hypothetical protein
LFAFAGEKVFNVICVGQVFKRIASAKGLKAGKKADSCTPVGAGDRLGRDEKLAICYNLAEIDDYTWGIIE